MNKRPALLLLMLAALLPLAACNRQAPAAADTATVAAPAAVTPGTPVAGVDYLEIPGGQPYAPQDGKVEVAEAFGYACPHCAHFEPMLDAWKAKLPASARFVSVPAPFGGPWNTYARGYFAAERLGLADKTHDALFQAIHAEGKLPANITDEQLAAFYAQHGANPAELIALMNSPEVDARLDHARRFLAATAVAGHTEIGTPMMIVNGKYRVDAGAGGYEKMLDTVDKLIARESASGS